MARRYPKELHLFLREYIPGHTTKEVAEAVNAMFPDYPVTNAMVKDYKANHGIHSGTKSGIPRNSPSSVFPEETILFMADHCQEYSHKEMAKALTELFGREYTPQQIKSYYANHAVNTGRTGRFEPGHIPANKGCKGMIVHKNCQATQFKKGHTPSNKVPIGTVLRKSDGYLWQKTGEGAREWKQVHRMLWEEHNGPVKKGYCLIFLDGNKDNITLENLAMISRGASAIMTRKGYRSQYAEITKASAVLAELQKIIGKKKKKGRW